MKFKTAIAIGAILCSLTANTFANEIEFSDINENDWFKNDIYSLASMNIINGYQDGTFRPQDGITHGEILKIAMTTINQQVEQTGTHWASGYLDKAIELKYISDKNINLDEKATRLFVVEMLSEILKIGEVNIVSPFEDIDNAMLDTLYMLGIVKGEEKIDGIYFYPNNSVTRAEVSALVKRTVDVLETSKIIKKTTYDYNDFFVTNQPTTVEDFEKILYNMVSKGNYTSEIIYDLSFDYVTQEAKYSKMVTTAFVNIFDKYPEFFTFANKISAPVKGNSKTCTITIELSSSYFDDVNEVLRMRNEFITETENLVYALNLNGTITKDMTEYQKAKVFFEWIALNKEYDTEHSKIGYTAYGISEYDKGVCQGYVSLFNTMCKIEGIEVVGVSGTVGEIEHIWSSAVLDGKQTYIDPTFGDPIPNRDGYCDFAYFDMSEEEIRKTHNF